MLTQKTYLIPRLLVLGLALLLLAPARLQAAPGIPCDASGECRVAFKCELPGCNPDPVYTYTASSGLPVCQVEIKAGPTLLTFNQDGCQALPGVPGAEAGYCVSGLDTPQVTAERRCTEGQDCHAISYTAFALRAEPSAVASGAVSVHAADAGFGELTDVPAITGLAALAGLVGLLLTLAVLRR